jgi:hypothetical protein
LTNKLSRWKISRARARAKLLAADLLPRPSAENLRFLRFPDRARFQLDSAGSKGTNVRYSDADAGLTIE